MTKVYLGVVPSALVVIGLSLCAGIALRCTAWRAATAFAREPDKPADDTPKMAEQQFKNIQALKGVPAEQLVPTMQFISASLGVECDFCHVDRQMDKDDKKEKQTARKMIAMQLAINRASFDGKVQVTCIPAIGARRIRSARQFCLPMPAGRILSRSPVRHTR